MSLVSSEMWKISLNVELGRREATSTVMWEFADFITENSLVEGGSFTWLNNQTPPSMSRIDRFLVTTVMWGILFGCCSVQRRICTSMRNCVFYMESVSNSMELV